jgi:hypothetical protein
VSLIKGIEPDAVIMAEEIRRLTEKRWKISSSQLGSILRVALVDGLRDWLRSEQKLAGPEETGL